ncbi:MAG: tRNA (adenosine(37)-N6)-threonylcarbamoyltransferase complex ATPase subunit type 1 TsaE [Rhodothermales bacterium]
MTELVSHCVEETIEAGNILGSRLRTGAVVGLVGDLGAGKTHFAKGIAQSQGVDPDQVSSPTFTIAQEYRGSGLPIFHLDCYRLENAEELERSGAHTYLGADGICLIEWPQHVESLLPADTILVSIRHQPEGSRLIQILTAEDDD